MEGLIWCCAGSKPKCVFRSNKSPGSPTILIRNALAPALQRDRGVAFSPSVFLLYNAQAKYVRRPAYAASWTCRGKVLVGAIRLSAYQKVMSA